MDRGYSTHSRHLMSDDLDNAEKPVMTQLKKAYWTKKQQIMKTIGKKEDEHVVASDAELDAKLELFKQIQLSCIDLLKVILLYQKRIVVLAREENSMGKFLKTRGDEDSTQAGKMMRAVGKSQGFSAQQRIQLRQPLFRLLQEVDTFRRSAIGDTQLTVKNMEEARTAYRAALLWMKDVSEQLDPDAYNRLEKFRMVQSEVRQTKQRFDKRKLDVMQKVDLLAASRSNMFSHALAAYQNSLLTYWKKTSKTMRAVSETFKGFQYYEFNMLKNDLDDAAKELAEQTQSEKAEELLESLLQDTGHHPTTEEDRLIYDIIMSLKDKRANENKRSGSSTNHANLQQLKRKTPDQKPPAPTKQSSADSTTGLIDFGAEGFEEDDVDEQFGEFQAAMDKETKEFELTGQIDKYMALRQDSDDMLDDIFGPETAAAGLSSNSDQGGDQFGGFLPADLLDSDLAALQLQGTVSTSDSGYLAASASVPPPYTPPVPAESNGTKSKLPQKSKPANQPISNWYNLFADLDPLQDPDSIGAKEANRHGCA